MNPFSGLNEALSPSSLISTMAARSLPDSVVATLSIFTIFPSGVTTALPSSQPRNLPARYAESYARLLEFFQLVASRRSDPTGAENIVAP